MGNLHKRIPKASKVAQSDVFAKLGSASAILNTLPDFVDSTIGDFNGNFERLASNTAMGFLFTLLQELGVNEEEIKTWLVDILLKYLPEIEIGAKTVLLKEMTRVLDCGYPVYIPDQLRKKTNDDGYFTRRGLSAIINGYQRGVAMLDYGVLINIDAIDPENMLSKSPFIDEGKRLYFGQFMDREPLPKKENLKVTASSFSKPTQSSSGMSYPSSILNNNSKYMKDLLGDNETNDRKKKQKLAQNRMLQEFEVENEDEYKKLGTRKPVSAFSFARALDMNAFIWLCIHKNIPSPTVVNTSSGQVTLPQGGTEYRTEANTAGLLYAREFEKVYDDKVDYINEGITLVESTNKSLLAMCINKKIDGDALVVPISSDWSSYNWYVNREKFFDMETVATDQMFTAQNFSHDMPIFNLKRMEKEDYTQLPAEYDGSHHLLFSVLPNMTMLKKQDLNSSVVEHFDTPSGVTFPQTYRIGFDYERWTNNDLEKEIDGQTGCFTVPLDYFRIDEASCVEHIKITTDGSSYLQYGKGIVIPLNRGDGLFFVYIGDNVSGFYKETSGRYRRLCDAESFRLLAVPCYWGEYMTELNYDYLMGMRLFDVENVVERLLDDIFHPSISINVKLPDDSRGGSSYDNTKSAVNSKSNLINMISKIIEGDEEAGDCLFTFTNDEYDKLLKRTSLARYNQEPYRRWDSPAYSVDMESIDAILKGYSSSGTLAARRDCLNRVFDEVMSQLVDSSELQVEGRQATITDSDKSSVKIQFCTDLLTRLALILIECILTPKVLMLFEVNRIVTEMNGGEFGTMRSAVGTFSNVSSSLETVVRGVVKEILNEIEKQLFSYIIQEITKMIPPIQERYIREQYEAYMSIYRQLISMYKRNSGDIADTLSKIKGALGKSEYEAYMNAIENDLDIDLPTSRINPLFVTSTENNNNEPRQDNC